MPSTLVLPRMGALAEVQWLQPEAKDFEAFKLRLDHLRRIYERYGWHYATICGPRSSGRSQRCISLARFHGSQSWGQRQAPLLLPLPVREGRPCRLFYISRRFRRSWLARWEALPSPPQGRVRAPPNPPQGRERAPPNPPVGEGEAGAVSPSQPSPWGGGGLARWSPSPALPRGAGGLARWSPSPTLPVGRVGWRGGKPLPDPPPWGGRG
jgi:hypothetical protein